MLVDVSYRMSLIQPCASLVSAGCNNRIRGTMSGGGDGADGSYLLRADCGWTFKIREKGSFVGVSDALLVTCVV